MEGSDGLPSPAPPPAKSASAGLLELRLLELALALLLLLLVPPSPPNGHSMLSTGDAGDAGVAVSAAGTGAATGGLSVYVGSYTMSGDDGNSARAGFGAAVGVLILGGRDKSIAGRGGKAAGMRIWVAAAVPGNGRS